MLFSTEVQEFIKIHQTDDLNVLLLQRDKYPDIPIPAIVDQIKARRKAKTKLPKWYNTEGIMFPKPVAVEQSSSEKTAHWKAEFIGKGASGIDLTGGFGIDTLYFANQFEHWSHIEPNKNLQLVAHHNAVVLGRNNINFQNTTAEEYLGRLKQAVDFIYIDPDRRNENQRVTGFKESLPDITRILPELKRLSKHVLIKASPMIDITAGIGDLEDVAEVVVLSVQNEVKEVLFYLNAAANNGLLFRCVDINKLGQSVFKFNLERNKQEVLKISSLSAYLYEPNASILKSGGQDLLAKELNLSKLHRNTNLYTSIEYLERFPGRVFKVVANEAYNRTAVSQYLHNQKANLSTRNFVDTPDQMKKKLRTKDGGSIYLFGYLDIENRNRVAVCQRVDKLN